MAEGAQRNPASYRDLLRAQADGEEVSDDRLRIFRREEDIIRSAMARPRAFQACGLEAAMFEAADYRIAWDAIQRVVDQFPGDGALPPENVLAEMRRSGESRFGGMAGKLWWISIESEKPVEIGYALEVLVHEVSSRFQLRLWNGRFRALGDRIDQEPSILGLYEEYVTESYRVGIAPDGGRLGRTMEEIANAPPKKSEIVPTGIPQIDGPTGGGHGIGELMVVGGGTNSGKSYMVQRLARNQARMGESVLCISSEDPENLLACRMIADYTPFQNRASPISIRKRLEAGMKGHAHGAANPAIVQAAIRDMSLEQCGRVYSYEAKKWTVSKICGLIRRHRYMVGIRMVIVDYLQAISADDETHGNKNQWTAEVLTKLKRCCTECGVALVVMSQYARDEYRDGQEPTMQACKYAGDIENEAEIMCLMWRDEDDNLHAKLPKIKWVKSSGNRYIVTTDPDTGNFLEWNDDFAPREPAEDKQRRGGKRP